MAVSQVLDLFRGNTQKLKPQAISVATDWSLLTTPDGKHLARTQNGRIVYLNAGDVGSVSRSRGRDQQVVVKNIDGHEIGHVTHGGQLVRQNGMILGTLVDGTILDANDELAFLFDGDQSLAAGVALLVLDRRETVLAGLSD